MRKLLWVLFFISITTVFVTGCSNQDNTNSKIQSIEDENKELRFKIHQVNSLSIAYQHYEEEQRFVPKESQINALPIQDIKILNSVKANTVIQVLDAAQCQDQLLWLYVSVPVYDTPVNYKGWIPESETLRLTKENVKLVQGDVFLKEGTPIYEVNEFNDIKSTSTPTKVSFDVRGRIEKREESFAYLNSQGGWSFWVEDKYLIFPKVD